MSKKSESSWFLSKSLLHLASDPSSQRADLNSLVNQLRSSQMNSIGGCLEDRDQTPQQQANYQMMSGDIPRSVSMKFCWPWLCIVVGDCFVRSSLESSIDGLLMLLCIDGLLIQENVVWRLIWGFNARPGSFDLPLSASCCPKYQNHIM